MEVNKTNTLPYYKSDYKKGEFKLIGRSVNEMVNDFYNVIIEDIKIYSYNPKDSKLIIDMDYYNSRTSIFLKDIFNILVSIKNKGYNVEIDWHYYKDDIDMADAGNDYSELTGLKFNLIKKDKYFNII